MRKTTALFTTMAGTLGLGLILAGPAHAQDIGLGDLGGVSIGGLGSSDPSASANIGGDGGLGLSGGASVGGSSSGGISASLGGDGGLGVSAGANGGGGTGGGSLSANLGGTGAGSALGNGGGLSLTTPGIGTPGIPGAPGTPGTPGTPGGTTGGGVTGNNSFAPGSVFSRLSSADVRRFRTRCIEVTANPFSYDRNLVAMCRLLQQSAMR